MRQDYADRFYPPQDFTVSVELIQFLGVVFDAVAGTKKVRVKVFDNAGGALAGQVVEGVARHVVQPDSVAFENGTWSHRSRLRVTWVIEFFIPLAHIEAIVIED